jgi:hypothetical protein
MATSWSIAISPTAAYLRHFGYRQKWLVIILVFVLFALGGHELRYTLLADVTIQGSLATRQAGHPLRLMGYGVLAVTALLGLQWRRPRATWADRRLLWCMVATFAWMGLSVLWSHITYLSIKTLVGALLLWVGCAGIGRQMTLKAIRTAGMIYAGAVCVWGVGCEVVLGTWSPFTPGYRFSGTTDPNSQGLICAVLITSLLTYAPSTRYVNTIRWLGVAFATSLLILTQSRGAMVALMLSIVAVAVIRRQHVGKIIAISVMCLLSCALLAALAGDVSQVSNRLRSTATLERDTVDAQRVGDARFDVWRECLARLRSRPLLGFGYGAFWDEQRLQDVQDSIGWAATQAHSGYIDTALNTGIIGLLGLLTTFIMALTYYIRKYRATPRGEMRYAIALIVLFLTSMLFESVTSTTYVTHVLALCIVMKEALRISSSRASHVPWSQLNTSNAVQAART